jgi:TPP-dependent 2-oxoacid decarboxylase
LSFANRSSAVSSRRNPAYTIERLILGPGSSYNDINQWRYAEAASFFDTQGQAIAYRVRTEDELEDALAAASDRETLVLIVGVKWAFPRGRECGLSR